MTNEPENKKTWGQRGKSLLKKIFNFHTSYVFPFSRRGLLTSAIFMTGIAPGMNAVIFPKAEDFAHKYDIPEAAVTELTGNVHTVVRSGILGRISNFYDLPPLVSLYTGNYIINDDVPNILKSSAIAKDFLNYGGNVCRVTVEDIEVGIDGRQALTSFSPLMKGQMKSNWLSLSDKRDLNLFIFFHELRHCHPDNDATDFREGDSDYHAIKMVEKLVPKTKIRKIVTTLRSLDREAGHDTVLYLEDRFYHSGKTSTDDIKMQSKLARDFIESGILLIHPKEDKWLPSMARRQVEIYKKSIDQATKARKARKNIYK